jgi:hypothetical protein
MLNGPDRTRRLLLGAGPLLAALPAAAQSAPGAMTGITPSRTRERRVGIAYALWHDGTDWRQGSHKSWGTPELGFYRSDDPSVLARHAAMLSGAGVDFIVADWSNDLRMDVRRPGGPAVQRFIEQSTLRLFDVWNAQAAAPKVVLMIGNPGDPQAVTDGRLRAKANEVHDLFVSNPQRAGRLQTYLDKPLLLVYVNTPSPWQHSLPPWTDDRFTVRFVTGFVTQQPNLQGPEGVSRYGYWSWEDRRRPTYSVHDGHPECMTVVAAWRGSGSPGRDDGRTYASQWAYARRIGPRFVLAGTLNEWWSSEQPSPQVSKDVEPSRELGSRYMDILKAQAALFKRE